MKFHPILGVYLFACALLAGACTAAEKPILDQVNDALHSGKPADALKLLNTALEKDPKNDELLASRATAYHLLNENAKAAADLSRAIERSKHYDALRGLGAEYFFAGDFAASVKAFDDFAQHFPDQAPQLWERGISLYYAKRYDDARKQFESHKTVNPNDVENAAWHFLCAAKATSIEEAGKSLIEIDTDKDTRVPMKQVYLLFKGEAKPDDVLAAAKANDPHEFVLKNNLCYAHLYLGLYYEAAGDAEKAREHIEKAATEFAQNHYMGKVAQIHFKLMNAK
ncbi:MAG TPA: tetratricopeptide repeat protein [Planctomycetota bacterium]|nr:tetratricopeptide repeat protein [Planctomycetota bacterium]